MSGDTQRKPHTGVSGRDGLQVATANNSKNTFSGGDSPPAPGVTDLYPTHRTRAARPGGPGPRLGRSPAEWTCKKTRENHPAWSRGHPQRSPPHLLLGGEAGRRTYLLMQQWAWNQGERAGPGRMPSWIESACEAEKIVTPRFFCKAKQFIFV